MNTKLPIESSFEAVENMIHKVVHKAIDRYKLDPDEIMSAAFMGFMRAFDTYSSDKGAWTTWVWNKTVSRIKDYVRKQITSADSRIIRGMDLDLFNPSPETKFILDEWLSELPPDAGYVARLVFATPVEIKASLAQLGSDTPANWRCAIRELLRDNDWSDERIKMAFRQIKERL